VVVNMLLAMDDTDKVKILVEDAVDICGLTILPPDINLSDYRFMPVWHPSPASGRGAGGEGGRAKYVRYGLGAVKGSGQNAIEAIVAARTEGGPFTSLFDFCKRVDKKQINRRTIESLIRAGAFDCLSVDRATLLATVSLALESAEQAQASANQVSLFGDDSEASQDPDYVKVMPWSMKQQLTEEKSALGYYFSGHLFNAYADEVRKFARAKLSSLGPSREPRLLAGVISAVRTQMTQRGKMVIATLDDGTATVDITVFNELFDQHRALFKEDEFLAVLGKVSEDRFSGGLRVTADKVMDLAAARVQFGREFSFSMAGKVDAAQIRNLLMPYRSENGLPLTLNYTLQGVGSCKIQWGDEWRVSPADELRMALIEKLGVQGAAVEY
jgi:DNA polymerase III subunit alpha